MRHIEAFSRYNIANEWLLAYPCILEFARIRTYKKKEIIYREGSECDSVYVLLKGVLIGYRTHPNGQQRLFRFVKPHEVYGKLTGDNHVLTIEAIEPAVNIEISRFHLEQLIMQHPDILVYLYQQLSNHYRESVILFEDSFLSAEARVVKSLINIAQKFGYANSEGVVLRVDMTQENLARYSQTTRVTVARVQQNLNMRGILRTKPKPWTILRMDALIGLYEELSAEISELGAKNTRID
ncbi:MAG: Crp/Fnr family transcriptional regulator [Peptococcaceae bacterium]|jgi:CRP-like cAMP-binding protein|nr:Crp/Fnr family transcriptional regulator [Peptococcaceae bacterium]